MKDEAPPEENKGKKRILSQDELKALEQECPRGTGALSAEEIEQKYNYYSKLADLFSDEKDTKENFYHNSIGLWEKIDNPPDRKADYTSPKKWRGIPTGETSSEYWYTDKGVYRRSDHWGGKVGSCSWLIKGRPTEYWNGCDIGETETAFIPWENLKPKTEIFQDIFGRGYYPSGGRFEKYGGVVSGYERLYER
ncbi:MAG: hypothetical protein IKM44_04225 [Clostridia bacterium]|nr:hypothetical protein [Clostridia bacterium]